MSNVLRYGSARLLASDADYPNSLRALSLVRNVDFGFSISRQAVKSVGFGNVENHIVTPPLVSVSFDYILSDLENEQLFGFPVTSAEAISLKQSIIYNITPIDLAFVTNEGVGDFDSLKSHSDVTVCLIKNAYLKKYSVSLDSSGLPMVSVAFEGEDILFKVFKNLTEYSDISLPTENKINSQMKFRVNDGTREPVGDTGGGKIISSVNSFSFSLDVPYVKLQDFGTFHHEKRVDFPITTSLNLTADVLGINEGELKNIYCQENLSEFIVTYSTRHCNTGYLDEQAGMLFNNARLVSQNYSLSSKNRSFLSTSLSFEIDITKNCGVFFVQQIAGHNFAIEEDPSSILLLEVQSPFRSSSLLQEEIIDMIETLSNMTC